MSSKKKTKAPQGRPASTAAISQPSVEDSSQITSLSSFSPDGTHFAFLSLAVDKHRLRVYSTAAGQSVAEHTVENARVSSMAWSRFSSGTVESTEDASSSPSKKKRRKKDATTAEDTTKTTSSIEVVLLGHSDGTILIFSPSHGRILRTLSHSSSSSPILALTSISKPDGSSILWTSSSDGTLRFWDTLKNELLGSSKSSEDRTAYTFLSQRPLSNEEDRIDVLAAHHSIRLLSFPADSDLSSAKPTTSATFTGHASPIRQLSWDASTSHPTRFISLAETDRFIYIWETPDASSSSSKKKKSEGKIIASIPLDSDARSFSLAKNAPLEEDQKQTLLTLSASGKLSIYPVPADISSSSSSASGAKLPSLLSRSVITTSSKATTAAGKIVAAAFVEGEEGKVRIARVVGGIRPVFDLVGYVDEESGEWVKEVVVKDMGVRDVAEGATALPTQRYTESSGVAISSGAQLAHDTEMDDAAERDIEGALDVDLAELSLGQRLTALSGEAPPADTSSSSEDSDGEPHSKKTKKSRKEGAEGEITPAPANTLTRTLIQALHSSDTRLLETCLAHSDATLIMSTVRRLPPQLSFPLIQACVERLGRGKRGGQVKGRGGAGASAQRGMGLVRWVRTVLVVHSGFLMTIPDLVARLSSLHGTLTARLALQESLLGLSGRLDMVLSQIELRSSATPAPLTTGSATKGKRTRGERNKKAKRVTRYIEGESEDSEEGEEDKMEVEVERDEDEGSVEDVELGGVSDSLMGDEDEDDEDESESEEEGEGVLSDEDDDEEDDDDDEGVTMNGFIDDEAEEYSEEDESDEE